MVLSEDTPRQQLPFLAWEKRICNLDEAIHRRLYVLSRLLFLLMVLAKATTA